MEEVKTKKIITSKDSQGVTPKFVVPTDKELGFMPKAQAVIRISENNSKASVGIALLNNDEKEAVKLMETLGYSVTKKEDTQPAKSLEKMNKSELLAEAEKEGLELAEDMVNKDIVAVIKEAREAK